MFELARELLDCHVRISIYHRPAFLVGLLVKNEANEVYDFEVYFEVYNQEL